MRCFALSSTDDEQIKVRCDHTSKPVLSPAVGDRVCDVIGAVRRVQTARPPSRGSPRTPEVEVGGRRKCAAPQNVRFQKLVRPVEVEVEETEGARGQ